MTDMNNCSSSPLDYALRDQLIIYSQYDHFNIIYIFLNLMYGGKNRQE